jgi:hypothetical protein
MNMALLSMKMMRTRQQAMSNVLYVHLCLDKDDAQSLIEELTELSEVNPRDAQKYLL